ncbi:hypothetical protein ABFT23_03030 [Nocardioides sp. C4-1]|uniref:hypothetical protein n=1 Tax=Nocardioides sp. C4-1 TaxID=3151851 RepID=UPI00326347CD
MKTRLARLTSTVAPAVAVPALVLALTACSGDDGDEGSGDEPSSTPPSSEATTASGTTTSPPDIEPLPVVNQAQGARDDITFDETTCKTDAGEQTVSGTLTNPTDKAQGYLVAISWTNATNDTLGQGFTVVRGVKPGAEAEWTVEANVAEGAVQCVPFAQRGSIPK